MWGISLPVLDSQYRLGLDLHGGVELDYTVSFRELDERNISYDRDSVLDGLQSIVEKRVNSLGTAEPTIHTAHYGSTSHIIVQIPTQNLWDDLSKQEQETANRRFIEQAKDTIGRVVRLEFKERKTTITDEDRAQRRQIAQSFSDEATNNEVPTKVLAQQWADQYERVEYSSQTGATLADIMHSDSALPDAFPFVTDVYDDAAVSHTYNSDTNTVEEVDGEPGYSVTVYTQEEATFAAHTIFVYARPSDWTIAQTADGRVLDERYLLQAASEFNPQSFQWGVTLQFNAEWGDIFHDLSKRLVGEQLAIFVGWELLTDPVIQQAIPDGLAVITGNYTADSAKKLAQDINTGIVPAPIYLSSENSIDPKLGIGSLHLLTLAWGIGFLCILIFLVWKYHITGIISSCALFMYVALVLAVVKSFWVVLTLSGIAGLVLSIGIAIDANILMLERLKEEHLTKKFTLVQSARRGFELSWSAIWDSNVTGLITACVLFIFGVSLIKGFGLMLMLGIISSLFVIRYFAYPLTVHVAKMSSHEKQFCNLDT